MPSSLVRPRAGAFLRCVGTVLVLALVGAGPIGSGLVGGDLAGATDAGTVDGAVPAAGPQPPAGFSVATVLSNLDQGAGGNPTAFAYAPDGRIFVARKTGVLDVYDGGVKHVYADLRDEVNSYQSRGLIGLALDPNFAANARVYLLFTQELNPADPDSPAPAGGQLISLTNAPGQPDTADPVSRVTLVTGIDSTATLHSVAGLRFANDGSLLVGIGDGNGNGVGDGTSIKALDLNQLNGKILRIDPSTGNGVPSNPYYAPASPGSVRSRVFARGFRNPFRFTVDPSNGTLYVGDVGWNTWEMFQVFPEAVSNPDVTRDAGWPCYEGGNGVSLVQPDYESAPPTAATCHAIYTPAQGGVGSGALAPRYGYLHSDPGGAYGSAIVGGPRYLGTSNYPTSYVGKVFIGDYARSRIQTVDLATGVATTFGTAGSWGNPVDLQIAPDGRVAFLGLGSAELDEIAANGSNNPPVAALSADHTTTTGSSLTVHFSSVASHDPDGDPITVSWDFGDGSAPSTQTTPTHAYTTGVYQAELTVTDDHGASGTATVQINVGIAAPVVKILNPATSTRFRIGDTIDVAVKANDPQEGNLGGERVSTVVEYWTGGHMYPVTDFNELSASFVAADNGFANAFYRITTTATNSYGIKGVATRDVLPLTVQVTVSSLPSPIAITVDGIHRITPYTFATIVGSEREVVAPEKVTASGRAYTFASWRVGGASATRGNFVSFTVPTTAMTVVATYAAVPIPPPPPPPPGSGYWIVDRAGAVRAFGRTNYGDLRAGPPALPIVGMAPTTTYRGYWLVGRDGGIFGFGDAHFYGSTGAIRLNRPVVGIAATPSNHGYWLVASDGGIFAFGDARFYGSTGAMHLNQPIVGMATTPTGRGYWLVASDGGIFAFGDARFYGSTGAIHLNQAIVDIATTPSGKGYWFVASDGGVFGFGDARFYGSTGAIHLNRPIVGMAATPSGRGYEFVADDGGIFNYGDAKFYGSLGAVRGTAPVVGLS